MSNLLRIFGLSSRTAAPSAENRRFSARVRKADSLRDRGLKAEAADEYALALTHKPNEPGILVQLGNMAKDAGQHDRAIAAYTKAIRELDNSRLATNDVSKRDIICALLADAHLQRGHAHKLARAGYLAVKDYAAAANFSDSREIAHELAVAKALWGEQDTVDSDPVLDPARQSVRDPIRGQTTRNWIASLGEEPKKLSQCICYSQNLHSFEGPNEQLWLLCRECGTKFNDRVAAFNATARFVKIPGINLDRQTLVALEGLIGEMPSDACRGLVGANCDDQDYDELAIWPGGYVDGGLERIQYDLLVVPFLNRGLADIRGFLHKSFAALKPGGILVLGFHSTVKSIRTGRNTYSLTQQGLPFSPPVERPAVSGLPEVSLPGSFDNHGITNHETKSLLSDRRLASSLEERLKDEEDVPEFQFKPDEVKKILDEEGRCLGVIRALYDRQGNHLLIAQRDKTMSVGVMSGIGDAVWSFTMIEALREKFKADRIVLHVHDSGDHRRKRSNSLLKRFSFVDNVLSSQFHVHASSPHDDVTGHIRYRPEGNTRLNSSDTFDYRLIINTHLERGQSPEQIARRLGLDPKLIDYDLFAHYQESPADLRCSRKLSQLVGNDYVIFHYGALLDNSEVGLNRGALWSRQDWNELGDLIHRKYGCRIVLVGAPYDQEYAHQVQSLTDAQYYVNTIGQLEINETIAVMRRSKFMVSFPSGIGILGPFLDVPTVVFWRDQNDSYHPLHERAGFDPRFATNWVPPQAISSGIYYPAWYGKDTPKKIANVIETRGWFSSLKKNLQSHEGFRRLDEMSADEV